MGDQIRSVAQSCPTLCDPMSPSTPGLPVHHQLLEFTQINVHRVNDAIQPSHPLSSPSPLAPNPSQHQCLFQHTKINSKWIKDLNIRPETIKLLEENIGKRVSDIHHSRILYYPPPRILEIKAKINKWDLIKIKSFCTTKL